MIVDRSDFGETTGPQSELIKDGRSPDLELSNDSISAEPD